LAGSDPLGEEAGRPRLLPSVGWAVLHLFGRASRGGVDAASLEVASKSLTDSGHQLVTVNLLGHKADLGFLAIGPDPMELRRFQTQVERAGVELSSSYVSLTEVSEYARGMSEGMKRPRLYPTLPPEGKPAFCFYPMSKRRNPGQNWYRLEYDERHRLMLEHGATGRTFSGRVLQLVTGSSGLDDYEWGVTLFGQHLDDLKDVVYTMRYDEASAIYADFGPFFAGAVADSPTEALARAGML
jgi:peroxiredoxin